MTPAIGQAMRELEQVWDEHQHALLTRHDPAAALRTTATRTSLTHLPMRTGAADRAALGRFYTEDLLPHLPADLLLSRVSRTVGRFRLVDECTVSFTHDRALPWLLPGVQPTGRGAEVLVVMLVGFDRGRIGGQRLLWDLATLRDQLAVPEPAGSVR